MESLLVIGLHTRPAVFSAKALGYEVYSVDYFGSMDLKEKADLSRSIIEQRPGASMGRISENYSDAKLVELAKDIDADKTILTSTLEPNRKTLGTNPKRMKQIKDKWRQLQKVERLGIHIPRSELARSRKEIVEISRNLKFPLIIKPVRGDGGKKVLLLHNIDEIPEIEKPHIVQEYVKGRPISVSTLSTKKESRAISSSLQILGSRFLNQRGFAYCGSVVPYKCSDVAFREAEEICRVFGVSGWNGVDFIETNGRCIFMEINSRFQGTYDCVELVYGLNLVDAHIKACEGELMPASIAKGYSIRLTIYAGERSIVCGDLALLARDIPCRDVVVEKGEPITTVVTWSPTRSAAILEAKEQAKRIYREFISNV
ncbi:MAG: ATP-grasp domain-containing protein [Candidatus Hydrothermarchaeales archaeon]